jgi:AbrB family looped-hinge helix DNA binding protein
MSKLTSSVSPKGQITIPAELREHLGVKPKDRVAFDVEGESVKITRVGSRLAAGYQSVPPLSPSRSLQEMTDIAWEEHAQVVAREGLPSDLRDS